MVLFLEWAMFAAAEPVLPQCWWYAVVEDKEGFLPKLKEAFI